MQQVKLTATVSIANKCGGVIDTVVVRIKTYAGKEGRIPILTDTVAILEGVARVDSTFSIPEDADHAKVIEVVSKTGGPVCSFTSSTCTTPKTCKNTAPPGNIPVELKQDMKYKVECNCQ